MNSFQRDLKNKAGMKSCSNPTLAKRRGIEARIGVGPPPSVIEKHAFLQASVLICESVVEALQVPTGRKIIALFPPFTFKYQISNLRSPLPSAQSLRPDPLYRDFLRRYVG